SSSPPRPPTVVATVNLGRIIDGLDEAKETLAHLKEQAEASKKDLQVLADQLKKIDADLEMMKDKKDTPEYRRLLGQKLEISTLARARQEVLSQLMDEQEGAVTRTMFIKVADAIKRLAASDGIDLVITDDSGIVPPEKIRDRADAPPHPITG